MNYFISYLVAVNLITFIFFWNDKRRSKKEAWRIPEKTLISLCLIGGSIGGILGMQVFHHKTKHALFAWGIPIILILQIGLGLLIFFKVLN
jgi:uncharacterized membrane protein YsdA (DUF1294 family)